MRITQLRIKAGRGEDVQAAKLELIEFLHGIEEVPVEGHCP